MENKTRVPQNCKIERILKRMKNVKQEKNEDH